MRRLRYGLNVTTSSAKDATPVDDARRAEELGFDFVSMSDHPSGRHPTIETWTLLTWIAAATSTISVASRVLSIPFRAASLVAKMAESLDRLSDGRLILGLGAGATDAELQAFGLAVPTAREKIAGLEDALIVIHGLWDIPSFTYDGHQHRTRRADLEPKPTRPIPIWLGTFGDRALAVTGRLADGWIPSLGYAPSDELPRMLELVRSTAASAGRHPDAVTCVLNLEIGPTPCDDHPAAISGAVDSVVDALFGFVEIGFDGFNFMPLPGGEDETTEWLSRDVVPALEERLERI